MSEHERLIELFAITEYRSGAVYRTQSLGERWVDLDELPPEGFIYAPLSTFRELDLQGQGKQTIRRKVT